MQKLLYLVHRIPYPPNKGDKIRSFHFLKALAEHYQIFLGTFIDDPDDQQHVQALKSYCQEVCCLTLQPTMAKIKSLTGLFSNQALSVPYYRNRDLQAWVDRTIREQGIERVLIFSSPMAQYLEKHSGLHFVADFVDVDSDKWRQYADNKPWPASWIYRREARKLLDFETRIAGQADATVFVSEQEAALFKTLAPLQADKIGFVNNGVDTEFFDPALAFESPFADEQAAIVFTGAMDYWANVDAVMWFAKQVWPSIKARQPAARFYIVGSKPSKDVLQLAAQDDTAIVTGRVDDVRPYLAHARLVVAPLRIARGIQNKVLEAMAMAKSIVATSAAMEGIVTDADLHIAVADEPIPFADQVVQSLERPLQPAVSNRDFVQVHYSWQHSAGELRTLLSKPEP